MKNVFRFLCVFALSVFAFDSSANGGAPVPVLLTKVFKPIHDTHGPSRNPEPLLEVFYNEASNSLLFYDPDLSNVTYSIHDEDNNMITEGACAFDENAFYFLSLNGFSAGIYIIYVTIDDTLYEGAFEIEAEGITVGVQTPTLPTGCTLEIHDDNGLVYSEQED